MIFLAYQLLFPLFIAAVSIKMIIDGRGDILKETPRQLRQRLGRLSSEEIRLLNGSGGKILWIHAASVGEVNAAAPLLKALHESPARPRILMTTSTEAGRKHAEDMPHPPDLAILAPADFYPLIVNFLGRARPYALLIMETELWPAMLRAASRRNIRILIANGRMTERAFRRYRWIRSMMAPCLAKVAAAAVQTPEDAARFAAMGLVESNILVAGNLKYDIPAPPAGERSKAEAIFSRLRWNGDPVWVAGSTWPDEERTLVSAFLDVHREVPKLKLVLAPRHAERSVEARQLLLKLGMRFVSLSFIDEYHASEIPDCLLVDQIGLLRSLYDVCTVAFVGGTLNNVGGHNVLEPAMAGKPVLFGPNTMSIQEAARALELGGGGTRVEDSDQLVATLKKLLRDQALLELTGRQAAATAGRLTGASGRTWNFLLPFLSLNV